MTNIPYRKVPLYLRNGIQFRSNSLTHVKTNRNIYEIYSYGTLIGIFDWNTRTLFLNEHRYSVTTARHQRLILEGLEHEATGGIVVGSGPGAIARAWGADAASAAA